MKRVLLIAFYFPPRNHIAGYRTGCFAKYLPEQGWLPTVICEDWPVDRPNYDPDYVGTIPAEVEIIRLPQQAHKKPFEKFLFRKLLPYLSPPRPLSVAAGGSQVDSRPCAQSAFRCHLGH